MPSMPECSVRRSGIAQLGAAKGQTSNERLVDHAVKIVVDARKGL